jgi:hypothetical protein
VTGIELSGRNLLIIGFGRIGKQVAARARAFGMNILVFDPYLPSDSPKDIRVFTSLESALSEASVVTLHTPLTAETRGMLGARELSLLPKGAIVVNASRGGLLDEAALLAAVKARHLHGAGLDTFELEPLPENSPLSSEPRIVLSPFSRKISLAFTPASACFKAYTIFSWLTFFGMSFFLSLPLNTAKRLKKSLSSFAGEHQRQELSRQADGALDQFPALPAMAAFPAFLVG